MKFLKLMNRTDYNYSSSSYSEFSQKTFSKFNSQFYFDHSEFRYGITKQDNLNLQNNGFILNESLKMYEVFMIHDNGEIRSLKLTDNLLYSRVRN